MAIFTGTAGADTLNGTAEPDDISGLESDDVIEMPTAPARRLLAPRRGTIR